MNSKGICIRARGLSPSILSLDGKQKIRIGSESGCVASFSYASADEKLLAEFVPTESGWLLSCSEGLVICKSDGTTVLESLVVVGTKLELKKASDKARVSVLSFEAVEQKTNDFSLRIYLPSDREAAIAIGSNVSSEILLPSATKEMARLELHNKKWHISSEGVGGVELDGQTIIKPTVLHENAFFSVDRFVFYYRQGCLYTSAIDHLKVQRLLVKEEWEQSSSMRYPIFVRSTRVRPEIQSGEIEVLPPKKKEDKEPSNLWLQILPQIGSLALIIVLRGIIGNGGTFVIYSASTMAMGIGVSLASRKEDKKRRIAAESRRKEKYISYINQKVQEITQARQSESLILHRVYRPMEENIEAVRKFDKGLFDRSPADSDFMVVRLGNGSLPARIHVKAPNQEYKETDDELMDVLEDVEGKYRMIDDVPIVCDFRIAGGIGVVGEFEPCYQMLKLITLDLGIRHYYKELRLYYIFEEKDIQSFSWTRWLPHCSDEKTTLRNLIYDEESAKYHLEQIYKILASREEMLTEKSAVEGDKKPYGTYYVIFVFDCERIRNHPLSQFFERGQELGCTFVFFSPHEELIPRGCTQLLRLDKAGNTGRIVFSQDDTQNVLFRFPTISDSTVAEVVGKLCPVRVVEANLESTMTKNITLFELLGVRSVDDINLSALWSESDIEKSMAVPLGVRSKNDIVYLDLDEKYHGPHGLVAGTTGSGKSEILQTYILSLSLHFAPDEVGFLLIDFKGGGMADQFEHLPHLIGTITNIDGREVLRSLKSIRAELLRRQTLFAEVSTDDYRVNSIGKYIHLHKTQPQKAPVALPHLIIIVDEFAQLKDEHPDFMTELISTARIGRSLGVHLILATQKPSGVVNEQIWSNSKFKLCLKVQTREDSKEVLKTPLAAEIREPGRAYLQVGNNEIFELFQSAYSGASVEAATDRGHQFQLHEVSPWGMRKVVYDNHVRNTSGDKRTELTVIVDYIEQYCRDNHIEQLAKVCMPPLATVIALDSVMESRLRGNRIYATVGILDDPEQHRQCPLHIDLTDGNTFILGASQSGKTVLLMTMILSLAMNYTPQDVAVYVVDGGNSIPKALEKSGIVGGICYREEDERLGNLIGMLRREIDQRRKRFIEVGVGGYSAYRESGFSDLPAMLIMIDNSVTMKEFSENQFEELIGLTRECNSVGMYFIVSSTQCSILPTRLMIGFGTRLALNCNDKAEYSNLFDRCRMEPLDNPGRGLIMIDKRILEFQTAWFAQGNTERERNQRAEETVTELNKNYDGVSARPIPMVPEIIHEEDLCRQADRLLPYSIPIGLDYSDVSIVNINLMESWLILAVGRARSGRTNFIRVILDYIQRDPLYN